MSLAADGVRFLSPEGEDENAVQEEMLLRQVAALVAKATGLRNLGATEMNRRATDSSIVLVAAPDPLERGRRAADVLTRSRGIQYLLANPNDLVVMVTGLSRRDLSEELLRWLRASSHARLLEERKYQDLASRKPLQWSFLSTQELSLEDPRGEAAERYRLLQHLAPQAIFDPTGLRSFVQLVLSNLEFDGPPGDLPPLPALVVDDELEASDRFGYLVRRMGYCPLIVNSRYLWRRVSEENGWLAEHGYRLAVVDNFLGFDGPPRAQGHDWLRQLPIPLRIFKTARDGNLEREEASQEGGLLVHGPPVDVFHLETDFQCEPELLWNPFFQFSRPCFGGGVSGHRHSHGVILRISHRLLECCEHWVKKGDRLRACLCLIEAFLLLRGRDGPAAAKAFIRLQELEVEEFFDHTLSGVQRAWPARRREIEGGMTQAFKGSGELDLELSKKRAFRTIVRTLRENLAPAALIREVQNAAFELRIQSLRGKSQLIQWVLLRAWQRFSERFNTLRAAALGWLSVVLFFGVLYATFGTHLERQPQCMWPIELKGLFAALAGGLGLIEPEAVRLGLPFSFHLVAGLIHRVLSVAFFGRMLELLISWGRDEL